MPDASTVVFGDPVHDGRFARTPAAAGAGAADAADATARRFPS